VPWKVATPPITARGGTQTSAPAPAPPQPPTGHATPVTNDTKQEPVWTSNANGFKRERNLRTDATVINRYHHWHLRSADIPAFGLMY